jgi:hypothetical protein
MATAAAAVAAPPLNDDGADELDDEVWEFPRSLEYLPYLLHLMSFVHNRLDNPYAKDTTFAKEQLLALQPHHIRRWMNLRAYGVVSPDENVNSTGCRSNSLLKAKQAISFYMPNKHVPWIDGSGGNQCILWKPNPTQESTSFHQLCFQPFCLG